MWGTLEGEDTLPQAVISSSSSGGGEKPPAYPSSAKKKTDWNEIEKSYEEEKPEGDAALNELFQRIYKDGTDETRKAMMKSFVESGGTTLSTNWDEVGKEKVPIRPPEGVEAVPWPHK
jgi:suppressor of G2 allele of SKP1